MGALAPVSSWLAEDDLLLKNAVEAGASLESLAKGAVQFSRKFTVSELHDRWHSLLYDPLISEEASSRMTAIEHLSPSPTPKFSRTGSSKESKSILGKRKSNSVRSRYYAVRKRIHNRPFAAIDLEYLITPNDCNFIVSGDTPLPCNHMLEGHFDPIGNSYIGNDDHPQTGNCLLEEDFPLKNSSYIGNGVGPLSGNGILEGEDFEETHFDIIRQAFPEILADDDGSANGDDGTVPGFHTGFENPIDEIFQKNNIPDEIPHLLRENLAFARNESGIDELSQPIDLPMNNMFEHDKLAGEPASAYAPIYSHQGNACSGIEEKQVFNSPISECDTSFHNLDYLSSLPPMPVWSEVDVISDHENLHTVNLKEQDLHEGDNDGHAKITGAPESNVVYTDSKLGSPIPSNELKSHAANTSCYLAELSNSLFNEEDIFIDIDGKDVIDKSYYDGLSSLLLNSPNAVDQDHITDVTEPETSATLNCLENASGSCYGESNDNTRSEYADGLSVENTKSLSLSRAITSDPQFPERHNGVIICHLNTEILDIPFNDHLLQPKLSHPLSVYSLARRNFKEPAYTIPKPVKAVSGIQGRTERYPLLNKRDQKDNGQSHASSQLIESQGMPGIGKHQSVGECRAKVEFASSASPLVACRTAGISYGVPTQTKSKNVTTDPKLPTTLKGESKDFSVGNQSFREKPVQGSDNFKNYTFKDAGIIKEETGDPTIIQNSEAVPIDYSASDLAVNQPLSEPKELLAESDDDVPYYSDIEAMILDMDLDPDDYDLLDSEVARYQSDEAKRVIIRLEQGAHSYMQRDIASHGAFAILYGRHSKHYIKKPEVLLGRATEDVPVDIDLAREGRANKVSRRQAIIHMNKDGCFQLKNLGKFSVSVNMKEVGSGQSWGLSSSCLIEIRGMPFIFETNETCVRRYLDGIITRSVKVERLH